MTCPIVETDLNKILDQINQNIAESRKETNQKLDNLNHEVTNIKVELAEVKGDIKALRGEINALKEDVRDIKGSQKAQLWTLIGILGTAVVGAVIRSILLALPPTNP
jgi:septal ring factor EnvC (AmiA/AmiB activator)